MPLLFQAVKASVERPTLRSVANAVRTGIFIEKIYKKMSKSQMMEVPEEVAHCLQVGANVDTTNIQHPRKTLLNNTLVKHIGHHYSQIQLDNTILKHNWATPRKTLLTDTILKHN